MTDPKVSVVLSVYKHPQQVQETINSVLQQSDIDWELVVIDDGAEESVKAVLQQYAGDNRVDIIEQENQGLTRALIKGCQYARADYIARIDVGDTMQSLRLKKQSDYLDVNQQLCLVTSWVDVLTQYGDFLYCVKPQADRLVSALRADNASDVKTPFHASVMFRREHYQAAGGYRPEFYFAQDADLWLRMMVDKKLGVIDEVLTNAIFSEKGISGQHRDAQFLLKNLAHACLQKRVKGMSEVSLLAKAAEIRALSDENDKAEEVKALYFIAKCLHDNQSPSQLKYWREIIRRKPLLLKAWWFYFKSKSLKNRSD